MIQSKPAKTDIPLHEIIKNRWSPLAFSNKPVENKKIESLLEAARWAPSSYNEQPWRYIVGLKGKEIHSKLAKCILDGNAWAREVPVLVLSLAIKTFAYNGKDNIHAHHDTGAANLNMFLQATSMDLAMHEMAGFSAKKASELFEIEDDFTPLTMIAIGYEGDKESLSDDLKAREEAERERKNVEELVIVRD